MTPLQSNRSGPRWGVSPGPATPSRPPERGATPARPPAYPCVSLRCRLPAHRLLNVGVRARDEAKVKMNSRAATASELYIIASTRCTARSIERKATAMASPADELRPRRSSVNRACARTSMFDLDRSHPGIVPLFTIDTATRPYATAITVSTVARVQWQLRGSAQLRRCLLPAEARAGA